MDTKISINVDGIDIVLEGNDAKEFLAKQKQDQESSAAELQAFLDQKNNAAAYKQSAIEKLAKLGLTADEAALLLK